MSVEGVMIGQQLEVPKSTLGIFELPCGYLDPETRELHTEVQLREIKGREEDMLNSDKIPPEAKLSALLAACIERVGTITDRKKITSIVEEMTTGDRVFLIFCLRRVSLGDELPVRESCPKKGCGANNFYVIDMADLKIKKMLDPRTRVYDTVLPRSKKKVRFRVSTGKDERVRNKIRSRNKDDATSLVLMMRIESIDQEPPTLESIADLGISDRTFLRNKFEEVEGGIDLEVELDCPKCGHDWKRNLELTPDFFSP